LRPDATCQNLSAKVLAQDFAAQRPSMNWLKNALAEGAGFGLPNIWSPTKYHRNVAGVPLAQNQMHPKQASYEAHL
jgi:hypothetical protein